MREYQEEVTIQVSEYPLHLRRYIYDTTMDIKRKISTSVMEWIRIQVQYYFIRYFTNYFLTSLENCLVYIFLSIVTSVDALNICAARHVASHQDYQA